MSVDHVQIDKVFLNVEEVKGKLSSFHIFDARYDLKIKGYGSAEYIKGHLPGAVYVDLNLNLRGTINNMNGRHPLPECGVFVEWCKAQGISSERPVLCYDSCSGAMGACRLWWMLDTLGVKAYVLNGGFQAYCASGLDVEIGESTNAVIPTKSWPFKTNFDRHVTVTDLSPSAVIIDSRIAKRYASTVCPYELDDLPGHIEGAINIPFMMHWREEGGVMVLRNEDEIRSNFLKAAHGHIQQSDFSECIFYCGSGITACFNISLVRHLKLGHPFYYSGSWSEYSMIHRFPIIRGILKEHGMCIEMLNSSTDKNAKFDAETMLIKLDGILCNSLNADVSAAVVHLYLNEKARVHMKSGRTFVVEIISKT